MGANFRFISSLEVSVDSYSNLQQNKTGHLWLVNPRRHTGKHLLVYCNFGRDLSPKACVSNRNHGLLWVPVHVHVQHEAAEGGPEVVGQAVIKHAAQNQIHGKRAGDLVDGKVLAVQTHFGKQVQLVPKEQAGNKHLHFGTSNVTQTTVEYSAITCNR